MLPRFSASGWQMRIARCLTRHSHLTHLSRQTKQSQICRELLTVQSDNAAALHNLSLIVADRGDLDEAASLSTAQPVSRLTTRK